MKPVPPGLFQYNDNDPQHQHGNQQGQFKPEHGIHGQYRKTQLPDDAQGHRYRQAEERVHHGHRRGGRDTVEVAGQAGHDLLGGVGHGGEGVRAEHGQADDVADLVVMALDAGQPPP